ncbi:MAG TPA: MFS transporter [Streptosporangiaceae bacterium]|jgi:MFS family permease|nr:MFS transporter [Streptosporangiaceae bacterium]
MTEQSTDSERSVPLALTEPSVHVRWGWITGLSLASLGMWMASLTPVQILLPLQLQAADPRHKIAALGIVTGVGAVAACIATPLAGALSDRTTNAFGIGRMRGRRHRWTLGMAVLGAISLVILGGLKTVAGIAVLWVLFSAFQNAEYASLSAAVPDHVPVRQRATVAGWVGMPQALGLVLGTVLVVDIFTKISSGYTVLAILLVLFAIPFVFMTPDHPLEPEHRDPFSWRKLARAYWISPRQYPDFAWAWITRFLASLAIAMGTLYLLYFLEGPVHYRQQFHQPATNGLQTLIIIYTVCVVVTAIVGGIISDRIGKRKMIVTLSGILMGLAALLLTFVETWNASLIAAVLFGLGFGAYLAVDQALITQVLPAARDRAKDLGIINIAIVGPSTIGPAIAAPITAEIGYPALFGATAIVAVLASVLVWRIKSVA